MQLLTAMSPLSPANKYLETIIWGIGLLLQLWLFISLFTRGIVRRAPFFTGLIGFYLLRSALLYLVYGFVSPGSYSRIYDTAQSLEVLVLLGVSVEVFIALLSERGWSVCRTLSLLLLTVVACLCTWMIIVHTPATGAARPDRGQIFFACLMLLLWSWNLIARPAALTRTIVTGFAFYGIFSLAAIYGRTLALLDHNAHSYLAWSYTLAAAHLIVVLFWLTTLRRPQQVA